MALSKFNVFIDDYGIVFNTLTGYAMALSREEFEEMKRSNVPENLKDIIEEGFSSRGDEVESLMAYALNKNVLEPTLLLTYNCNFDCIYCFQRGFRSNSSVSEEVVRGFINYVRKNERGRKVRVTYFGGEPLLELRKIEEISQQLQDLRYTFSVVTNGSLLTPSVVERLLGLGLTHVQVTLDGPEEVHDRRRYFTGGRGSFNVILGNLQKVQDKVNVVLRINIDSKNLNEVEQLLRELSSRGITNVRLDPHLVHSNLYRHEYWENLIPSSKEAEVLFNFWEKAEKHGFQVPQDVFRLGICVAHVDEDIVVDPMGNIYPCWAFTGNPRYVKARLLANGEVEVLKPELGARSVLKVMKSCTDCPFLPMCMGGCRFLAVLTGKGYHGVDCRKETLASFTKLMGAQLGKGR